MTFTGNYPLARSSGAYVLAGSLAYELASRPGILLAIGLTWLLWESVQYLQNSHKGVLQFLRPIALLTMWVAPAASYVFTDTAWYSGYRLWVPAEAYFRLAGPGTATLLWGLHLTELLPRDKRVALPAYPRAFFWVLLLSGLSMQAVLPIMTGYFRYPIYLGSWLVWPALLLGMTVWPARRNWLAAAGTVYALVLAVMSTFFGMALLWVVVLWTFRPDPGGAEVKTKSVPWRVPAGLAAMILFVLFLISFKYDYREQKAAHPGASGLFFRMAWDKLRHPAGIFHPEVLSRTLSRLNQGFHTAQAMAYVPSQTPFVYGETLVNDLWGALVPRFLDPGKPRAGGKENLRRFAGQAHYRISANIGVYGEAYVNFGMVGGWAVLLAYGGLLGLLWQLSARWLGPYWGPYLFLPAVHLESDIGIVLNHISKSTVVAVAITLLWHGIRACLGFSRRVKNGSFFAIFYLFSVT